MDWNRIKAEGGMMSRRCYEPTTKRINACVVKDGNLVRHYVKPATVIHFLNGRGRQAEDYEIRYFESGQAIIESGTAFLARHTA